MKKLIAIALALVLVLSLAGCDASDYKKAVSSMDAGDYAAASAAFKALGDYKDSADLAKKCDYSLAKADYDAGNYEDAAKAFEALGDYEDCADLLVKANDAITTKALVGSWETDAKDYSDLILSSILTAGGDDLADALSYCNFGSFDLKLGMTIKEDGTYSASVNQDSYDAAVSGYLDALKTGLKDYYVAAIEANLSSQGYTLEDAYAELGVSDVDGLIEASLGMTYDDLFDALGYQEFLSALSENLSYDGKYTVENGALTFKSDGGDELGTYDAAADTVTLTGTADGNADTDLYPQVFHRA